MKAEHRLTFSTTSPHCDGILYDEMWLVADPELRALLQARNVVWETGFRDEHGNVRGGTIIAQSEAEARSIAFSRGLGEEVCGPYREADAPPAKYLKGGA